MGSRTSMYSQQIVSVRCVHGTTKHVGESLAHRGLPTTFCGVTFSSSFYALRWSVDRYTLFVCFFS